MTASFWKCSFTFGFRADGILQTTELTRLQVGTEGPVNIIVSTIVEAENILPLLLEYKDNGRPCNVRFSIPQFLIQLISPSFSIPFQSLLPQTQQSNAYLRWPKASDPMVYPS